MEANGAAGRDRVTFDIEINGHERRVTIEPAGPVAGAGGLFRARIDGEPAVEVTALATDLGWVLAFEGRANGVDVAVTDRGRGEWLVQLPHLSVTAAVGRRAVAAAVDGAAASGAQRIVAPMPGRIVRVLVQPGDTVSPRQGLVIIEAMKMENELGAARAGVVTHVGVAEGLSVEAGRLLVVVE